MLEEKTKQEELIVRYLFGELSEEQRTGIEQRFLSDGEFFEEMLAVEGAIFDRYAANELSGADRERMEKFLLGSRLHQQELEFTRDLIGRAVPSKQPAHSWNPLARLVEGLAQLRRPAVAAAAFALIVALAALLLAAKLMTEQRQAKGQWTELQKNQEELRDKLEQQNRENADLKKALDDARNNQHATEQQLSRVLQLLRDTSSMNPLPLVLYPGAMLRSEGKWETLELPRSARTATIFLEVRDQAHDGYSVVIEPVDGSSVILDTRVTRREINDKSLLRLTLPAGKLEGADYVIKLTGLQPDREPVQLYYYFRVKR